MFLKRVRHQGTKSACKLYQVPVWVPTAGLNPKCKLIHEIIVSLSTFKKNTLNISNQSKCANRNCLGFL